MPTASTVIAIISLIFYVPTLLLALYICTKHTFTRSSGWLYTLILCIIRIISSILQIVSYTNPSKGLLQTAIILDSVGISPLLLATLGILSRFVDLANTKASPTFKTRHFRIIQVVITVGLVLAITGGTGMQTGQQTQMPASSKSAAVLYVVGFVAILFVLLVSVPRRHLVPRRERNVPIAIFVAVPFIAVRLLYTVLSVFVHDHLFNIVTGSVAVRVGMATVEEFVVVGIYVFLGMRLKKLEGSELIGDGGEEGSDQEQEHGQWVGKERSGRR